MPVYPAAMSTLAQTTTGPARWHATRVTAAVLSFCALVLVLVGLFLPLYSGTLSVGPQDIEVTITPWSADVEGPSSPGDVPRIGYPLVFAAIVLACSAGLNWYAATPAGSPGAGRAAATTTAVGGAFLIGTVWTTALTVVNAVDNVILLGTVAPGLETDASYLVGHWLLLVAGFLSLGAAVLALIPVRQPTWGQVNPEVATPPYGIALVPAQPQPPQPGMFQVDPLTGHPMPPSPPGGVPVVHPPQPYTQHPPQPPHPQQPPQPQPQQPQLLQQPQPPAAAPPAAEPPAVAPPAMAPPAVEPPAVEPFASAPPTAEPPASAPLAAELPAAEPQAVMPPASAPPAVEPPAVGPPAPPPPAAEPPAAQPPAAGPVPESPPGPAVEKPEP